MKKFLTPLFAVLLVVVLASSGFAQPSARVFYYISPEPPLTDLCAQGTPLPDGISLCLYWDNNNNGPDISDSQPPQADSACYGCVNQNCWPLNGELYGEGAGHFVTDPAVTINNLPVGPADTARYYWRINSAINGDSVCWTSAVYVFVPGVEDIFMAASDWTCVSGPCQLIGDVPAAPTNVHASNDSLCLDIQVYWDHDGQNVSGFNVYEQNQVLGSAGATDRAARLIVTDTNPHAIHVKAFNAIGESTPSNTDTGSTYLLRFADGPTGDLQGSGLAGEDFTIWFSRPESQCPTRASLFIVNSLNVITDSLCSDSFYVDSMTCVLPNRQDTTLRLVLRAFSIDQLVTLTDTTESYFNLRELGAGGRDVIIPDHFALEQNYPNPFNPTTTIDFAVPFQSDVKIEVYNITGQLVKTLVSGSITAGVHHIAWDGLSDGGVSVSSGLYFYRMFSPGFVQTKKMLMMK